MSVATRTVRSGIAGLSVLFVNTAVNVNSPANPAGQPVTLVVVWYVEESGVRVTPVLTLNPWASADDVAASTMTTATPPTHIFQTHLLNTIV